MFFPKKQKKAFTLIELLVSLSIIIILVSTVVMNYNVGFTGNSLIDSQVSIYQSLKLAQNNALSYRAYNEQSPYYWGLCMSEGASSTLLFADINDNYDCDEDEADPVLGGRDISLSGDIEINNLMWVLNSSSNGTSSKISILFSPGDNKMAVYDFDELILDEGSTWYIELKDRRFDVANLIIIEPPGKIDTATCSCNDSSNYCCSFCSVGDNCIDPTDI